MILNKQRWLSMNLYGLNVEQIYELANNVLRKFGKVVQADTECYWDRYEDKRILIHYGGGYHDASFRVCEKQGDNHICVLETHLVYRNIASKTELMRDMVHHGFCDSNCPGFTHAVPERAYEIYLGRNKEPGHDVDDWLKAESEILEGLERKFSGDWEVATLIPPSPHPIYGKPWGPYNCVILKHGDWIEHLKLLASTL